jgi:hypothetical protein
VIRDPGQNDVVRFDAGKNFSDGVNKAPEIIGA